MNIQYVTDRINPNWVSWFDYATGIATTFVRYKQVQALMDQGETRLHQLNLLGIILGWTSSLGMCVVGNFQVGWHLLNHVALFSCLLFLPSLLHSRGLSLIAENHTLLNAHSWGSVDLWCWSAVRHGAGWCVLLYAATCSQQKHVLDAFQCGSLEHSQHHQQYPSIVRYSSQLSLWGWMKGYCLSVDWPDWI